MPHPVPTQAQRDLKPTGLLLTAEEIERAQGFFADNPGRERIGKKDQYYIDENSKKIIVPFEKIDKTIAQFLQAGLKIQLYPIGLPFTMARKGNQYFAIYYGVKGRPLPPPQSWQAHLVGIKQPTKKKQVTIIGSGDEAVAKAVQLVASDNPAEIGQWFVMMVDIKGRSTIQEQGFRHGIDSTAKLIAALNQKYPEGDIQQLINVPIDAHFNQHSENRISALFEWAEYGDLFSVACERVERAIPKPLTFDERLSIINQLARVIAAIHEVGWVHRDPKLANILWFRNADGSIRIKLGDFGFAQEARAIQPHQWLRGTEDYADGLTLSAISPLKVSNRQTCSRLFSSTPEAMKEKIKLFQAMDVYSFGVMILELTATSPDDKVWEGIKPPEPIPVAIHDKYQGKKYRNFGLSSQGPKGVLFVTAQLNALAEDDQLSALQAEQWQAIKKLGISMIMPRDKRPDMPAVLSELKKIEEMATPSPASYEQHEDNDSGVNTAATSAQGSFVCALTPTP
jgi:serine/threonine protein kinase